MSKQIKDLTNKKFGKLTVLTFIKRENHRTYWNCICDCGNYKIVGRDELQFGYTKSCGCLIIAGAKMRGFHLRKPLGDSLFEKIYTMYIRNAKKRNIRWNLTKLEVRKLTQQNCHYCGQIPLTTVNPPKSWTNEWKNLNTFKYNGIDRVDNSIGYQIDNCVSCCKICNRAKKDLSLETFNLWIKILIDHHKQILANKGSVENEA
jgi:hypothetical protein